MTRIIDAHHHVWDIARHPQTWMSPDQHRVIGQDRLLADYEAEATAAGVSGSVLVQTVRDHRETPEFLALAADSALVLGVVGWVDLDAGAHHVAEQVEALLALPGASRLVGLRDQSADRPDPAWALSPEAGALFAAAGAADLVVDLLLRPDQVPAATAAVAAHPGTRFVLDHLGNVDLDTTSTAAWAATLTGLASSPHAALKLSAAAARAADPAAVRRRLPGVVEAAVDLFGASRVIFGSDWPVSQMSMTYAEVVDVTAAALAGRTEEERRSIWSGSATRWYGLEP